MGDYSKASRYTASSCTDLAGARFWIGWCSLFKTFVWQPRINNDSKICKASNKVPSERLSPNCTILSSLCFTQISWTEPCRSSKSALLLSGSRLAKYFWLTSCRRMQLRCQLKNWGNAILKLFKVSRFLVIQNLTWNIYKNQWLVVAVRQIKQLVRPKFTRDIFLYSFENKFFDYQ